jgi:hypothetical protein
MWLMLAVAITVSYLIDLPMHTLWGLTAYGPWLVTVGCCFWWARRSS